MLSSDAFHRCICVTQPMASLRGFVEDMAVRSGFRAEVADRAAELVADMAENGGFDD